MKNDLNLRKIDCVQLEQRNFSRKIYKRGETDGSIMTSQHRDIMMTLDRFFADETNFKKLESLLSRNKRRVSLRLLHFTAQNAHKLTKRPELANRYQTTLESAGKKYFDAFRRHSRFNYELDGNKVETNAAQLRFIKYIIEN